MFTNLEGIDLKVIEELSLSEKKQLLFWLNCSIRQDTANTTKLKISDILLMSDSEKFETLMQSDNIDEKLMCFSETDSTHNRKWLLECDSSFRYSIFDLRHNARYQLGNSLSYIPLDEYTLNYIFEHGRSYHIGKTIQNLHFTAMQLMKMSPRMEANFFKSWATRQDCPSKILALCKGIKGCECREIANHRNTPKDVLEFLAKSNHPNVSKIALERLAREK